VYREVHVCRMFCVGCEYQCKSICGFPHFEQQGMDNHTYFNLRGGFPHPCLFVPSFDGAPVVGAAPAVVE